MTPKVCITGVGACTPLGHTCDAIADSLLAGRSGVAVVERFDSTQHPSRIAAMVDDIPCPSGWKKDIRQPRVERALIWSIYQALSAADLWGRRDCLRIGTIVGLGCEWLLDWEAIGESPPPSITGSAVNNVCQQLGIHGPTLTLSAACASGNIALALGRSWLRQGLVDVCLSGGADMAVTPMTLAGFGNLRALSRRNDDPIGASRPFDRDRDGFVLGEGAALLTLERESDARRRGVELLAEVAGYGATSDAHHLVSPCPDVSAATSAIRLALADADIEPDEIDYVNAHGTGTPLGDVCEAKALYQSLGDAGKTVPVSATKSMTGHLLTASAAFEAIACLVSMEHGAIAPTINLEHPDPECALHHVAGSAIEQKVNIALSNSFGFGGSNTALILRKAA